MRPTLSALLESVGTEMIEEICAKGDLNPQDYRIKVIIAKKGISTPVDFRMGLSEDEWIV